MNNLQIINYTDTIKHLCSIIDPKFREFKFTYIECYN